MFTHAVYSYEHTETYMLITSWSTAPRHTKAETAKTKSNGDLQLRRQKEMLLQLPAIFWLWWMLQVYIWSAPSAHMKMKAILYIYVYIYSHLYLYSYTFT